MQFTDLRGLLIFELEDLLDAEQQLAQALPQMAAAATDNDLQEAFEKHLQQTRDNHIQRLHEAFDLLDHTPKAKTCKGMQGILREGDEVAQASGDAATRDAALIGAAQRAEHYEMAAYGTARAHAHELGLDEVAGLLQETLDVEGETNKKLTKLAEGGFLSKGINPEAEA